VGLCERERGRSVLNGDSQTDLSQVKLFGLYPLCGLIGWLWRNYLGNRVQGGRNEEDPNMSHIHLCRVRKKMNGIRLGKVLGLLCERRQTREREEQQYYRCSCQEESKVAFPHCLAVPFVRQGRVPFCLRLRAPSEIKLRPRSHRAFKLH
jgi:hypothetical protein